jgi:carbamate kinase
VSLGGNALLRRGEPAEAQTQRRNIAVAAGAVAALAEEHEVVLTHGNGPQVGLLALQTAAYTATGPYPLDVLGAESEGMIGYLLEEELSGRLNRPVATLLTMTRVAGDDPAFERPTKPIGPVYGADEAGRLARERGWVMAADGPHQRRVVPSPTPLEIVELRAIRLLVDAGVLVICTGGGGVPVVADDAGRLHGVEAVIDKDLASALLAERLGADVLLMLTDVPAVKHDWGGPDEAPIAETTPDELRRERFAAGSMGPKVEAAIRFAERTGGVAAIGALDDAVEIVAGRAGTRVTARRGRLQPHAHLDFSSWRSSSIS